MRLIDADMAIKHLTKARMVCDSRPMTEIFAEIPSVDVLDKIRAEIQAMSTDYCGGYIGLDKQEVLKIIDKYRNENI